MPKSPRALAQFLEMLGSYKHSLRHLAQDIANLQKLRTKHWTAFPSWAVQDFNKVKKILANTKILASPWFEQLNKYPFILRLDYSSLAATITLSQIQKCRDQELCRRLIYCSGVENRRPLLHDPRRGRHTHLGAMTI